MDNDIYLDADERYRFRGDVREVFARFIAAAYSDEAGLAFDFAASSHATSERSAGKLGDWTFGQDSAKNGTKDFFIMDADGVVVARWAAGVETNNGLPSTQYTAVAGDTPKTLTGAQIAGAADVVVNMTGALGGAGTLTTPTAALLVAAIPGARAGMTYRLRIINSSSANFAWTLTAGSGVTLTGTMSIAQNTWRDFYVTLTSLTAVGVQNIGTGTFS